MAQTGFDFEKPITAIETELEKLRESLRKKTDALREKEAKEREKKIAELEKRLSDTAKLTDEAAKLSDTAKFTAELTAAQEPISERTPEQVDADLAAKIRNAEARLDAARTEIYAKLTPWQRVQIARHPARPHALDYIHRLFSDWTELSGDRHFGDDKAVVAGFGRFKDQPVAVIGQQKGVDTKDNILRNFGMMHPEGYRKAMRVMKTAEKFGLPIIILIDTPGAYPGIGAEERGQGEAIGRNIMEMTMLRVPIICAVIGEGASGGALGIGVGDRLLMLQYAWYCVISPEGCASILWRDQAKAPEAAQALKLTADDLLQLQVIDEIVPEPLGGAHRDPGAATDFLREAIARHLDELLLLSGEELIEIRFGKYREMGNVWLSVAEAEEVPNPPS